MSRDQSPSNNESFHRLTRYQRLRRVQEFCDLTDDEIAIISGEKTLSLDVAEHLIENVIGYFPVPLGVATHFKIDGRELLIPMAVEETSIIAASSATAKWVKQEGSIRTYSQGNLIIGQIQLPSVMNVAEARSILHENRETLIALANACIPGLVGSRRRRARYRGSRTSSSERRRNDARHASSLRSLRCDGRESHQSGLRSAQASRGICSPAKKSDCAFFPIWSTRSLPSPKSSSATSIPASAKASKKRRFSRKRIPYRAATHNKGVLNGIDPILIATGNDWRAVEAGVHAYAARSGKYQPVTDWKMQGADLVGRIEIPMAVGTVGGVTRLHPTATVALKMLGVEHAEDLARICAAVGLVQNLGALRALATVGIVKGHMQLHAANLAIAAGAEIHEIARVRDRLAEVLKVEKKINLSRAKEILASVRGGSLTGMPGIPGL